ncbi:uncharacterized protein LOC142546498 isoform X1 [Primulina tabacum]|uniref:uncharacterized protein LOC142546498 isoform X1 n=1 Tax=Primulina tabacum TaxID=48773 RepID=UPI003F59D6F7
MSEGNDAGGFSKSRSVLGDVTNRLGKRGFYEREKSGVKSYSLNDKDNVKHVRVSPRQCTDLDLLKGDVLSRISKVSAENNKGLNVKDSDSSFAFSERSIDVEAELTCGYGNSEEINGENAVKLIERKADSPSVNPMFAADNVSVNTIGDTSSSVHEELTMRDKIGSRNGKGSSFTDLEMGRIINFVDSEAGGSLPFAKFDSLKGYKMLEIPNVVAEKSNVVEVARKSSGDVASNITKISKSSYLNLLDLGRGNAFECANIKAKNKLGDVASANTSSTVSDTGSDCLLDCINRDAGEAKVSLESTQKNFANHLNEVEGHNADNFITSQFDAINCAIFPDSQESKIFGVEKSSESKKKKYPYMGGGVDAIKTCSCSFCTKAAYIWLDLNYQDIKGRVSATRKSQKEASILAERSRMTKGTEKHDSERSARISKLEIDLMHQWKFLFQHMAGIWGQEGDHLETTLSPLTDLREKCKRDLGSD